MMPSSSHGRHFSLAKVIAIATGKPTIRQIKVTSAATAKLLPKMVRYSHSVARL